MSLPAWAADYIGIPFLERGRTRAGLDCWGLVWDVYRTHFGIELPSYVDAYQTTKDLATIRLLILEGAAAWTPMPMDDAEVGDVCVLRVDGSPWHVGLMLNNDWFIHVDLALGVVREQRSSPIWYCRVILIVRHPALVAA